MIDSQPNGAIHVHHLNLWAHVGVLENERSLGQEFLVDFTIWLDMDRSAKEDNLSETADYSYAINKIQQLALETNCYTIEHFCELILDSLEALYGALPMNVFLRKCSAPVPGFNGSVGVERCRNKSLC